MPYKFDFTEYKKRKIETENESQEYFCNCDFDGFIELYTDEELNQISNLFKMFGNPIRLQILKILTQTELCVCAISEIIGQSQTLTSQHLSKLKSANLIIEKQEGKFRIYSIKDDRVRRIIEAVSNGCE